MKKKVVVFAGNGCNPQRQDYYYSLARKTGKLLAKEGFVTVTGGGPGLMDQVCRGAFEAEGETIGVCLTVVSRKQSEYLSKKYIFHSLIPRLKKLVDLGDAFVVLPGGIGTFHEIFTVLALKRKLEIPRIKPLIIVDPFYKEFRDLMDKILNEGFADSDIDTLYITVETPEEAISLLKTKLK